MALGVNAGISKSEVSRICAQLDEEMNEFRARPLSHLGFPYLLCDATYVKARVGGRVVSRAVVVVTGVAQDASREVLGVAIGDSEDAEYGPSSCSHCANADCTASSSSSATHTSDSRPPSPKCSPEPVGNAAGSTSCALTGPGGWSQAIIGWRVGDESR